MANIEIFNAASLDDNERFIAQSLFLKFLSEEFEKQGLNHTDILTEGLQAQGDSNKAAQTIKYAEMGASLREKADEFNRSAQRQPVRDEADKVDLETINQDDFWCLMDEVFKNGMTKTHIIALFFFCSDILIRSVRQGLKNIGIKLFKWAIGYIFDKVCKWIHDRGGWETICTDLMNLTVFGYIAIGALVVIVGWGMYRALKN